MKSIIICEGRSDVEFLQYFMRKVYGWKDSGESTFKIDNRFARNLEKDEDTLTIASTGGISYIVKGFDEALNYSMTDVEPYSKIVVIFDYDDNDSRDNIIKGVASIVADRTGLAYELELCAWNTVSLASKIGGKPLKMVIMPLSIPYTEEGALETFLLSAISAKDEYDRIIIDKGNAFVNEADPENRYLKKRRWRTKSKLRVFFDVRTAEEQYVERSNIYKSFPWEEYPKLQKDLCKLGEI